MNTPVNGDTAGGRAVLIVCLQSLFVHDARDYGNAPSGHAIGLIGISPPPGSLRGALLCCDGSPFSRQREKAHGRSALGLDASIIIAPLPVITRCICVHRKAWHGRAHGRKTVERALYDSVFKVREGRRKISLHLYELGKGIFQVIGETFLHFSSQPVKNPRQTAV